MALPAQRHASKRDSIVLVFNLFPIIAPADQILNGRIEVDLGLGVGVVQLAKMIAHRREPQRLGDPVAVLDESFTHESPELLTLTVKQAELN